MINTFANRKRVLIAVLLLIFALAVVTITTVNFMKKPQKNTVSTVSQPSAEEIKIVKGKTVELGPKAIDLKKQIIAGPIREDHGDKYLVQSREFTVIYVPGPDQFYIQINNQPAADNKTKAQQWFLDKGFTNQDLCGLGLHFQLATPEVTQKEISKFNTAANGCPTLN